MDFSETDSSESEQKGLKNKDDIREEEERSTFSKKKIVLYIFIIVVIMVLTYIVWNVFRQWIWRVLWISLVVALGIVFIFINSKDSFDEADVEQEREEL